ncbi:DUF6340 family protein [Bacteroides caecigallinarum]|uniref:DUF6340 family protein n=1 Tax=Bacteroides caecigallinarum TaxID=1411144 RepID=UPI001F46B2B5|nr:DUF6340 family protein [Bacteroides caecigallinarum]MCF2581621.1 tetratricopeptide repeat protein [Bacteroides caecigallinarum]
MKKHALYIILLVSVLMSSCASIQTLTFDQLSPAEVNFPYQVSVVGVVNNMPSRPKPKSNILTLGPIEAEGKGAAETLSGYLADSKYFNQVIICDSALCSDAYSTSLSADEVSRLSSMLGVDMIISFERLFLDVQKKELTNPGWDVAIPVLQTQVVPVVRLYIPKRQKPIAELVAKDTLYFDLGNRISEKELIDECTRHASSVICNKIVPYWQTVNRIYFDGGCVEMRDAGVYVREDDWTSAREQWTKVYNRLKKGNTKFRAAYNMSLSFEMTGDMEKAEEWLKKATDCVEPGSEEEMVLKYYTAQFTKRKDELGKLNVQMGRFNNNF